MTFELKEEKDRKFYLVIWWILTFGLLLASRFPALTQISLKVLIPLLFIICLFHSGFSAKFNNKGLLSYALFFGWACLSIFYTVNLPLTMEYLQAMLGNLIIWFIVVSVILHSKNIFSYLIPLLLIFLIHGYFGLIIKPEVLNDRIVGRAQGITSNPNQLGFIMWYGIVVGTMILMTSRKLWINIIILGIMVFFLLMLFNTGSRKSLAATLVFLVISGFMYLKNRNPLLMLGIVLGAFFTFQFSYDYILNNTAVGARLTADNLEGGANVRLNIIEQGIEFFKYSPIVGIGLGSFSSFHSEGFVAHNDYIEIIASMGLVGFLIYMGIFYDYFRKLLFLYRNNILPNYFIIALGFIVGYLILGTGRPAFLDPFAVTMLATVHGFLWKGCKDFEELDYSGHNESIISSVKI